MGWEGYVPNCEVVEKMVTKGMLQTLMDNMKRRFTRATYAKYMWSALIT